MTRILTVMLTGMVGTTLVLGATFPAWADEPAPTPGAGQPTEVPAAAPDPRAVALGRAEERLRTFATKEAREALEPLADRAGSDAAVAMALARVLEQEKKYDDALKGLDAAARLAPADPVPQVFRGDVLLRANRTKDAEQAFTRARTLARAAVQKDPEDASGHYALGVAEMRLRQYGAAQTALLKARELRPADAMTEYALGVLRAFQNRPADSVAHFDRTLQLSPDMAYAYFYRGMSQDRAGRKDLLVADMERFLRLAPEAPEAERARAIVRAAQR